MTFERRRAWAAAILLLAALLGGAWLARLDFARKISTDVLDLIPEDERSPELTLVRTMASAQEARTMLFVLSADGSPAGSVSTETARRFAEELRRSGVFAQAVALADTTWRDVVGRELFARRMVLLFPSWLEEQQDGRMPTANEAARTAARELKAFLEKPEAVAFQDLVPADPLLLMPRTLERLRGGLAAIGERAGEPSRAQQLVWAQLAVSPLREEGQGPAFAAIEQARVKVEGGAEETRIRVAYTGVNRFAAASRARIEREVSWLNVASVLAVLAVACVFIRAVHRALHLVPVIGFATLGAWVATTAAFERVHVVVLALGALLAGVAIDYGFYLFMQPPAGPDEAYPQKVRRLAKPLLASCGTTVAGFALLVVSDFPMIRQLGVFVGAGLVCALAAAGLYFALLRHPFLAAREWRRERVAGARPRGSGVRRAIVVVWVIAVAGLARVQWRDDVRDLEVPAPEIALEDARIREAFGQRGERAVLLSHGRTLEEARAAVAELERVVAGRVALANLAAVVPTRAAEKAARAWTQEQGDFEAALRAALEAEGFEAAAFEPFFAAWREYARESGGMEAVRAAVAGLQEKLVGPLGLLLHVAQERSWFVSIARGAVGDLESTQGRTVAASQLSSLNRLFAGYRAAALRLSLAGLALVGVGVLLTYGVRDGLRIFAIPCGTCLAVFGVFGWVGQPLNMFHLLGAFLGVCLTHNYSIFTATSVYRGERMPVSVRLSALTTGASFAVLACSGIPVVRALGLTVAAMVGAALVVIELEALRGLRREDAEERRGNGT